jgi:uncharacterized protein YjbJ (UPF0337 family)
LNWDRLEGQWKQQRGRAVYHWGRVMNDELSSILGKYEELVGKLQERYGIAKDEAMHRVEEYKIIVKQLKQANLKLVKLHEALSDRKKSHRRQTNIEGVAKRRKRSASSSERHM